MLYAVPGHGSLRLTIPDGWQVSSRSLKQPSSVLLRFRAGHGDAFNVQLTAVWLDGAARTQTTRESIKANVRRSAEDLIGKAVEKSVSIQEFREAQTVGYYYALTDRNPAPGEYKYLTQGTFLAGELLSVFTILSHAPDTSEVGQALQMFGKATYVK